MQPTAAAVLPPPAADMDLQTMQSMDWLFKKERIYLLAQFWQQRATLAEKEVSSLKEQLASNSSHTPNESKEANSGMDRPNLESELQAKEKEISQLVEEVQRLQNSISKLQESSMTQISRLEEQLEHKRQHIARLEARLDVQKDYDELKREISILRSIDISGDSKSLELLFLERTKALQQTENPVIKQEPSGGTPVPPTPPLQGTPAPSVGGESAPMEPSGAGPNGLLFPPPLQNVETFGSFLGEEIVANWRRSLERTILAGGGGGVGPGTQQQLQQQQQQNQQQQQQPVITSSPPADVPVQAPVTPVSTAESLEHPAASTPVPASVVADHHLQREQQNSPGESPHLNGSGGPKSPEDNNNVHTQHQLHQFQQHHHHHQHNSNSNGAAAQQLGTPLNAAAMCAVNSLLRGDELKSPYRFGDEHRSPFRFADELGMPGAMVGRLGESLIPKGDPMEARLQEMLRYNMDKYATQNLDTLHIARRVRELLSIHNIGQRLFAKYILGLSQGTVSELLSKPKPWDKLTEKGRDSYRKMHAWACDENAVMLLKSLIPKKGKDTGIPTFGRNEADMTEERIAHILSEASHMMKGAPIEDSHSNDDSKSPSQGQCPSPFSKDSSQNRRLKKYENDDIPQEKVIRIYQEELAKLMGRRAEDMRGPRDHLSTFFFPQFLAGAGGLQMDRTQEEIRMALDAYHRELAKLNQCQGGAGGGGGLPASSIPGLLALQQQALAQSVAHLNGGVQDLSLPKGGMEPGKAKSLNGLDDKDKSAAEAEAEAMRHAGSAFSLVRPKLEPGTGGAQSQTASSTASSPLGNSILPPAMTPTEEFTGSAAASPLQRMASITNSLISQPPPQTHHSPSQRPLKAVLPPITQQQFDLYNNLNTEDIVKKVKEQLSQYSISQRLFGESVLGLSQGSVSDLLARPKPWHMLTQKGREPFIRMKMFLEDENAVHKLVASQYKIAPEKLMRTGGYGGAAACSSIGKPLPATPKIMSEAAGLLNKMQMQEGQGALLPPSLQLGPPTGVAPQPPPPPMLLTPPGIPPHHAISLQSPAVAEQLKKSQQNQSPHGGGGGLHQQHSSPISQPQSSAMRSLHQHISPSVYEMAALTQDLDTQTITTKIKEALLANNIGQKIFGEAVLGLSQGSVSELLSKPKPWHMLSIKGREPFIRMQLWLNDAHNIDRLQALKNERREANKRRRSSGPGAHDNSSDTSSNDTSEFYHSNSPGPGPPSAKKQRVLFSEEQKEALRLAFALDPYPNVATIEFLAGELALSSRTITNWFHNHRMRLKQQVPHGGGMPSADIPPRDQSAGQPPFDPVQFRLLLNQRLLDLSKERMGLGGVPLPYPPYFAANSNIAALISRGLLPTGDVDLSALGNAVKEQISGLDLSMTSLKREPSGDYDDEDDVESNMGSEDSNMSGGSGVHGGGGGGDMKLETKEPMLTPSSHLPGGGGGGSRSSRRKPAAPQWVNPEWQDEGKEKTATGDEVIINGVCVMQTPEDYGRRGVSSEETVRVEPTAVLDHHHRFDDDASDASSVSHEDTGRHHQDAAGLSPLSLAASQVKQERGGDEDLHHGGVNDNRQISDEQNVHDPTDKTIKTENEEERWEY